MMTLSACGWCTFLHHNDVKYVKVEIEKFTRFQGGRAEGLCVRGIIESRAVECERHPCQSRFFRQHLTCEDWCPVPFVKQEIKRYVGYRSRECGGPATCVLQ
jgi:hypothetical protein